MNKPIQKSIDFLNAEFDKSEYYKEHPDERAYRFSHTMRVANIGKRIAKAERLDETALTIACVLHDVGYAEFSGNLDNWLDHGRASARIARPFIESLGLPRETVEEMCFGIAIHVDDEAGFPGERTLLALSVADADNIDRYDAYRLHEALAHSGLDKMSLREQLDYAAKMSEKLEKYARMEMSTPTATKLFRDRANYQLQFYRRLKSQLVLSTLA